MNAWQEVLTPKLNGKSEPSSGLALFFVVPLAENTTAAMLFTGPLAVLFNMKDTFYFPHDCNAIQDPKMMKLLTECGIAGVGAYWIIIEILHQQPCGAIGVEDLTHYIEFYGKMGGWSDLILTKIRNVLFDTKLLLLENDMVFSGRVKNNLERRAELSAKGKENALKRWGSHANPMPTQCDPNAIKERKGKERKDTTKARPQNAQEVTEYARSIGFSLDGEYFMNSNDARGWVVGKARTPIKDWKAVVRTWKANQSKFDETPKKQEPIVT